MVKPQPHLRNVDEPGLFPSISSAASSPSHHTRRGGLDDLADVGGLRGGSAPTPPPRTDSTRLTVAGLLDAHCRYLRTYPFMDRIVAGVGVTPQTDGLERRAHAA